MVTGVELGKELCPSDPFPAIAVQSLTGEGLLDNNPVQECWLQVVGMGIQK